MSNIALSTAATGLSAQATNLEIIANNLANSNTPGYKASRVNFQDLMYQERKLPGVENRQGLRRPIGLYVGLGVKVAGTQLDFSQGPAVETGRNLDLYIDGNGFFQVEIEDDIGDGIGYTRAGHFTRNQDGELVLATDHGRRLIPSVVIPDDATIVEISPDGIVSAQLPGQTDPTIIATIELATFLNPAGLRQIGENLYVPSAATGDPTVGDPGQNGRGLLRQSFLEGSNVDPVTELVALIRTQRAFEFNSQAVQAADEALQQIGNLRRF